MDRDAMDRMLTATGARLRRAWIGMVAHLREINPVSDLQLRMYSGDPVAGLEDAAGRFANEAHNAYINAGQTAAKWLNDGLNRVEKKLLTFDPADDDSAIWAAENKLDLIREITVEQRMLIRDALMSGEFDGPRAAAQELRDIIGLTKHQWQIVENYRRSLEGGDLADALERELSSGVSDRVIRAAMQRQVRLTQAQIDTAVSRYTDNLIQFRAEVIAQTEGSRIAHQGVDALYRQAIKRGDVQAAQLEGTWNHSPTAKDKTHERAFHVTMHGQTRPYGEPFLSGLGNELMFPGDPNSPARETVNCRCVRTMRLLPAGATSRAA